MSIETRHDPLGAVKGIAAARDAHGVTLADSGTKFLFYTAIRDGMQEGYRIPSLARIQYRKQQGCYGPGSSVPGNGPCSVVVG
ncbi:hypothetical protein [Paenarthrobacter sp. NPDC018779]|uniref:hypothetical protein n=1 Tax=Paenarthrobacter sp. NPDC018779 TaxID=3364375 RepID=UPI0037C74BCC